MGAPSWMGGGSYEKNPGWYRSPQVGGGLQWNPQYGFQRKQTIEAGLASGKDPSQWGMTANTGQDWQKIYPGARTDQQLISMGLAGRGNTGYKAYQTPGGWYDYSNAPNQAGTNKYPGLLQTAIAPQTTPTIPGTANPTAAPATVSAVPTTTGYNPLNQQGLLDEAAKRTGSKYGLGLGGGARYGGEYI